MKTFIILLTVLGITGNLFGQGKVNAALQKQIFALFETDQKWRNEYNKINNNEKSAYDEATINREWANADRSNLIVAKKIVQEYGFPGYSLVGQEGSNKFWAIIQHCDDDLAFQKKVSTMMDNEVKSHNASPENLAMLKDRILVSEGKKQIYGTQVRYNKDKKKSEPFPIEDPKNVDCRRKSVGLSPLAIYLKLFNR